MATDNRGEREKHNNELIVENFLRIAEIALSQFPKELYDVIGVYWQTLCYQQTIKGREVTFPDIWTARHGTAHDYALCSTIFAAPSMKGKVPTHPSTPLSFSSIPCPTLSLTQPPAP